MKRIIYMLMALLLSAISLSAETITGLVVKVRYRDSFFAG